MLRIVTAYYFTCYEIVTLDGLLPEPDEFFIHKHDLSSYDGETGRFHTHRLDSLIRRSNTTDDDHIYRIEIGSSENTGCSLASAEMTAGLYEQAQRDANKLAASGLRPKAEELLTVIAKDSFQIPPPYEKLVGDLAGAYARRINIQHRLVYHVLHREHIVRALRLWTHYE